MRCVLCVLILCLTFWSGHGLPSMCHTDTGPQRDMQECSPCLCASVAHSGCGLGARHAAPLGVQVELLEGPIDNGLGVQTHPLLQDGGIQAPEVVVELEVSIRLLCRCQGWVLTIQPSLDFVAYHQSHAAGTVVRARAVVFHPTTKLAEQQHGDVVPQGVLVQVSEEILDVM